MLIHGQIFAQIAYPPEKLEIIQLRQLVTNFHKASKEQS